MRILVGFLGGVTALVLCFVALLTYVSHRLVPKSASIGVDVNSPIKPPFLVWEILSFAIGFTLVYMVSRPRA